MEPNIIQKTDFRMHHLSRCNIKESSCGSKDLHAKYVIDPVDKATGNATFIYQGFHAPVIIVKELGLLNNNNNNTNQTSKNWFLILILTL